MELDFRESFFKEAVSHYSRKGVFGHIIQHHFTEANLMGTSMNKTGLPRKT